MTSKSYDPQVIALGQMVAAAFVEAAGKNRNVDAHGVRMKDGAVFVAATNDKTSPLGQIHNKLIEHYGDSAKDLEKLIALRETAISITGNRTSANGFCRDRVVTINGQRDDRGWDIFTSRNYT